MSTLIGDSVIARRVHREYVVFFGSKDTMVDIFELDIVDFDVILGKY